MRVYELARELGLESKEVLERAVELGIEAKTASSGLDDEAAGLIKLSYEDDKGSTAPAEVAAPVEETPPAEEAAAPVAEAAPETAPAPDADTPRPRRTLKVAEGITVQEFAELARCPMGLVVKGLIERGQIAGASQPIPAAQHSPAVAIGICRPKFPSRVHSQGNPRPQ